MTESNQRPERVWVGRRYFEGRCAAEIARWEKRDAKNGISAISEIENPEWVACNEWNDDVKVAGLHDSVKVVVTELHVE